MSCGENRRTSAISGLFHSQNARQKRVRFRGYHKGDLDKSMDLNPHTLSPSHKSGQIIAIEIKIIHRIASHF